MAIIIDSHALTSVQIKKLAIYAGLIACAAILVLSFLVFIVSLWLHLLLVIFVATCTYANHQSILTQVLLLLVIGYVLFQIGKYGARGLRFFRRG